jgi:hypothetical protein
MVIILADESPPTGAAADDDVLVHPAQRAATRTRPHTAAANNPEYFM